MTASLNNPADVVNASLVRIGQRNLVANLYDGSANSVLALGIYGQTRDEFLRSSDWDFAQRSVSMTLLKQAPANYIPPTGWDPAQYPPLGWSYEYAYVDDCLKVRAVKPTPLFIPDFDPGPNTFSVANDRTLNPPVRVILCNIANAVLIYTARVTDPAQWAVDFSEGFIELLAERLGPALASAQAAQFEAAEAAVQSNKAAMEQG